ncbi:MAG: hypothetical protein ABI054_07500 [Planctomycetota bacterium]
MGSTILRQVTCPECGGNFSARGLSGHRRLQHGTVPRAALPAKSEPSGPDLAAILNVLASLVITVERIEQHLFSTQGTPVGPESASEEESRLKSELASLLEHIRSVDRASSDAEIARWRRAQARMVFRLDELRRGVSSDESFLV